MSAISKVLREAHGNVLLFKCPGCNAAHSVRYGGDGWSWDGDAEKPTFTPSVKVTFPANPDASDEYKEWRSERICHSFVTDGRIQFLGDCTHGLAGQTIDLPDWEDEQ